MSPLRRPKIQNPKPQIPNTIAMNREELIAQKIAAGLSRQQAEDVVSREEAERIPKLKAAVKETAARLDVLHERAKNIAAEIGLASDAYQAAVKALHEAEGVEQAGQSDDQPDSFEAFPSATPELVKEVITHENPTGPNAEFDASPSGPGWTLPDETPPVDASAQASAQAPAGEAPAETLAETPADEAPAETPAEKPRRGKGK